MRQKLTNQKRLELILNFLATYDSLSATLQWSYLPEKVRATTDKIPREICTFLNDYLTKPAEAISIGVRLAHELGLQTLPLINDFPNFDPYPYTENEYADFISEGHQYISNNYKAFNKEFGERYQKALDQGDLLPYYHYLNSPKVCQMLIEIECLSWLQINHPSKLGRVRLADWEVRNLVMTAYVRRASAMYAGKRILVIVGCSHKPLFDRYLKQLTDVEVVQFREIEKRSVARVPLQM